VVTVPRWKMNLAGTAKHKAIRSVACWFDIKQELECTMEDEINPFYRLSEEEWEWFLDMLERPARDCPKLRNLMNSKPIWEDNE
jgi:hypothetical protein